MKSKVSVCGFMIIAIIGVLITLLAPWTHKVSVVGHHVLSLLMITIGMWIFKPFKIPFSVAGVFLMATLLVVKIPPQKFFLDLQILQYRH